MEVRRVFSLYDKDGHIRERLIPIEKYSDIPKPSGVENKTFRKSVNGKPLQEKFFRKTKTRLNKWDMKRISTWRTKK